MKIIECKICNKEIICPYCFLEEFDELEELIDHSQFRHDYPLTCTKEYVIKSFKQMGWRK